MMKGGDKMLIKIIAVAGVMLLAAGLAAQNPERMWNFDSDKTDNLPEGFTSEVDE
jgi:hypothetical protein